MNLKTFNSFSGFATHLLARQAVVVAELHSAMKFVTTAIRETAQAELGHYQPAVESFDAWAELADSTKERRVHDGYTENDPLLASGELKESIKDEVVGLDGYIGTEEEKAIYLELGSDKMPPRSFLGPAVVHNRELIHEVLGGALVSGLLDVKIAPGTRITSQRFK